MAHAAPPDDVPENTSTWQNDILGSGPDASDETPVDLSFLNAAEKPAGKRGFLHVEGEWLVFADGTRARFWGTNITAYALFGDVPPDTIRRQAHRLSQLGFNLVRIHHHDSGWVNPNIFGARTAPDTKHLSEAMLKRLDWWIKCLKDEGIYVWLDLEVLRPLKPADGIVGYDEISKKKPSVLVKGYNYVNPSIRRAMQQFNETYLNHRNDFTGLRYKDDPAIIAVLLTNENDLTYHFGNALVPNQNVPWHNARFNTLADAFAAKYALSKAKVRRAWEQGPSRLFLNNVEHRFDVTMIDHLRALGLKVPVATTSYWGEEPLSSLPALTTGDLIDAHAYSQVGELEKNPLATPTLADWIAAAHIAGRPLSVTEWNAAGVAVPDRHAIPLYIAGFASLQGIDALMQYAYAQRPITSWGKAANWSAFNDPALIATLPAAALLYRRDDVQESSTTYVFAPSTAQLFNNNISPATSVALRTAAEKGRLLIALPKTPQLPWLTQSPIPPGAKIIRDTDLSLIDSKSEEIVSDTGELRRNWHDGVYTIDTPRSQAVIGQIGGRPVSLADVDIAVATRNATVAVQSLDENPISKARSLLISLGARSVANTDSQVPFRSEPVVGRLTIRAIQGLTLYKRRHGKEIEIPASYERGRYQINLDESLGTYWLLLK